MTLLHRPLVAVLACAAVGLGVVGWSASASPAAAPTTFSLTVAGTDTHSLDPHMAPWFQAGGGVTAIEVTPPIKLAVLEAALALPVGAKVTSVAISYKFCAVVGGASSPYVFGSYAPATRATVQHSIINAPATCDPRTVTKTGHPIITTVAGRRYVLDYQPTVRSGAYPTDSDDVFYGAMVKYTCTSPCVP